MSCKVCTAQTSAGAALASSRECTKLALQFPVQGGVIIRAELPAVPASELQAALQRKLESRSTTLLAGAVVTGFSCTGCDVSVSTAAPAPSVAVLNTPLSASNPLSE